MRFASVVTALTLLAGCTSTESGPAACAAAGGTCVLGGNMNCARSGPQNCSPDLNPGGAFCCLELVDADSIPDGGDAASGDGGGACTLPDSSQTCAQSPGLSCCAGACVNEENDPHHCGGCGVRCAAPTSMCLNGVCHVPTCAPACDATQMCCLVNSGGPPPPPSCVSGPTCPLGCPTCR